MIPNTLATFNFFLLYWNIVEFFFLFNRCLPYPSICQYILSVNSRYLYTSIPFLSICFSFSSKLFSISNIVSPFTWNLFCINDICYENFVRKSDALVFILFRYSTCSSILIYITSKLKCSSYNDISFLLSILCT